MKNRSNRRVRLAALLAATLTLPLCASLFACGRDGVSPAETAPVATTAPETTAAPQQPDYEYTPPTVSFYPTMENYTPGESGYRFVDQAEKDTWLEPLTQLLSHELPFPGERSVTDEETTADSSIPAIPASHACALLDVTADGTPELLVFPVGGGGSSGNAFYHILDIFSGKEIGTMQGGHDQSWCYYYDTEANECRLYGQFQWRIGASGRTRQVQKIGFLEERQVYESLSYLRTEHTIDILLETTADGNELMDEVYAETHHYVEDKPVSLDDYYREYDRFTETCVRIPETALIVLSWDDVTEGGAFFDGPPEEFERRAREMAYALTHSEQAFLKP